MSLNSDTQAAILLTVWFGKQPEKPLTIKEIEKTIAAIQSETLTLY